MKARDLRQSSARAGGAEARADALERLDNGQRLALLMEEHVMDIAREPRQAEPLDAETAQLVASELLPLREGVVKAASRVPLNGNRELHLLLNELINRIDDVGAVLAERHVK